jgi:succinyl-CoA synthetase beta subunit
LAAIEEVGVEIPVVVRLEGNSADIGSKILSESGVKIESRNDLADAAKKAVELSR